jgi:3-methyladenine DNA glycosylase/8-oxoguanine DNA glycosylase
LRGAGDEPISFAMTLRSHGCAALPPAEISDGGTWYRTVLHLGGRPRALEVRAREGRLVATTDELVDATSRHDAERALRRMFRLDENLAPFYARIVDDPRVAWAAAGAGRLMASPSVFEDLVKTVCTTNCAWSGTERMTAALVALGEGSFPTAQRLAQTRESWFGKVARAGYRGAYLREIAGRVATGALDLEELRSDRGLDDAAVEEQLLALPGVGPYACAHVMMLLGRYRRLILDSWTRPTYLRLAGMKRAKDRTIARAFAGYGEYAGLAFWLFLTRGWHAA